MKQKNFKKWFCLSVILPGITFLISKKASARDAVALCHLPAPPSSPFDLDWWYQRPMYVIIAITVIVSITVGFFLLIRYFRKRRTLKDHLKKGSLSKEDFEKFK